MFTKISIPGIPNVFNTENIFLKLLWAFLVLISFTVGFYNIADLTQGYYNYEVITNVERFTDENFTVPAITICSILPHKRSYYKNNSFVSETQSSSLNMNNFLDVNKSSTSLTTVKITSHLDFFNVPKPNPGTYPLDSYDCLRFNGAASQQLVTIKKPNDKFLIVVNNEYREEISNDEYFIYKSRINYFFVFITDNYLNGFDDFFPTPFPHGKLYGISIIKSETEKKLGEPYNPCKEFPNEKYHKMNCVYQCIFENMSYRYNCTLRDSLFKIDRFEECEKSLSESVQFRDNAALFSKNCNNKCPTGCESVKFSTHYVQQEISDSYYANEAKNSSTFFEFTVSDLSYLKITQIPKKTTFEFVSADIGGALGLFMGISFLNFIEIFEFILHIFFILFIRHSQF